MSGITVTRRGSRLLATKTAEPGGDDRVRHEADVLQRVRHPGVVELVASDPGPPVALHTAFVGTDTWARRPPTGADNVLDGLEALASTVADLHELGIAHRAVEADHVLVAADGRPVLCSLGRAGTADDTARREDLGALAHLIEQLAAGAGPTVAPTLETVARRAEADGVTAAALAADLAALRTRPAVPSAASARRPSWRGVAAVAAIFAIVAAVGWSAAPDRPTPAEAVPAVAVIDRPPASTPTSMPTASTTPTSTPTATSTAPPSGPRPAAGEPLVVEHGGRRYGVGDADHIAVVGDWNCDGAPTAAVLDPAAGAVAFFTEWPGPGDSLGAAVTVTVPEATGFRHAPDGSCGQLRVVHPGGSTLLTPEFP